MAEPASSALPPPLPSIEVLNGLSDGEFVAQLAPLFEGGPAFLSRLASARPFGTYSDLWPPALEIARAMPEPEQLELINAHPRLGAPPASVSAMSFREQGYGSAESAEAAQAARAESARVAAETAVAAELARLNADYEAHFGFRYCVFVNGRTRAELLPGMAEGLTASRPAEIHRAITDIIAIAEARSRTLTR